MQATERGLRGNGDGANAMAFGALSDSFVKMMERNRTIAERMVLAVQEESLRFVNLRLERTSKAIRDSRECHGLTGLIGVQHEWLVDAARDYVEESRRFGDVIREIAAESAGEPGEAAAKSGDQVQSAAEQMAA